MINILTGLLSAIIILFLFSKIEKQRVPSIGNIKYIWIALVVFSSYLVEPTTYPVDWFIWLVFLYTALDDLKTRTVLAPIYILVIGILFFYGKTIEDFIFAIIVFVVFILISKKSKETFFKQGDVYAVFALAFWVDEYIFAGLIVALFLAGAILPVISVLYKCKYYAFVPFLVIGSIIAKENWYIQEVLSISLVINICWIILLKIKKTNKFD